MYNGRAIAAGMAIGLAGLLNLHLGGGLPGALAFGIGLLLVCVLRLDLLTGKMRAYHDGKIKFVELLLCLGGNIIGVYIMYGLGTALPSYPQIKAAATAIVMARADIGVGFVFIRGIICGICVQMAVDMWTNGIDRNDTHPFLAMLPASAFVLLGCNHCIADVLYLVYSDYYIAIFQIIEAMAGNIIGALVFVFLNNEHSFYHPYVAKDLQKLWHMDKNQS